MKRETRKKISEAMRRNWAEVKAHEAVMRASAAEESRRYRYRKGKTTVVVHLEPELHEALVRIKLDARRRGKRPDGKPIALSDVVCEALRRFIEESKIEAY